MLSDNIHPHVSPKEAAIYVGQFMFVFLGLLQAKTSSHLQSNHYKIKEYKKMHFKIETWKIKLIGL